MLFPSLRSAYVRVGRPLRLVAAGACLLLAGVSALESSRAAQAHQTVRDSRAVVVAAHELAPGHVLQSGDLRVVRLPRAAVPDGANRDPARLIGRRLATRLTEREPLVPPCLLGAALTRGLPDGVVATAVALDDGAAGLLHPGDRVDLVSTPARAAADSAERPRRTASTLVSGVRVLAVLDRSGSDDGVRVVLAVQRDDALRIAVAKSTQMFTVILDPP